MVTIQFTIRKWKEIPRPDLQVAVGERPRLCDRHSRSVRVQGQGDPQQCPFGQQVPPGGVRTYVPRSNPPHAGEEDRG